MEKFVLPGSPPRSLQGVLGPEDSPVLEHPADPGHRGHRSWSGDQGRLRLVQITLPGVGSGSPRARPGSLKLPPPLVGVPGVVASRSQGSCPCRARPDCIPALTAPASQDGAFSTCVQRPQTRSCRQKNVVRLAFFSLTISQNCGRRHII